MDQRAESGSARSGAAYSLLLESGLQGPLLGISDRARLVLGDEDGGLLHVQSNLVQHYFRLQNVERALTSQAQSLRRGSARTAVRQVELERQRLGRELHTGVGQMLAAIRLQLEVVSAQLREPSEAVRQALGRIGTLASDALEQVRSISRRLHPPEWQRLTLEEAIRQLWESSGVPQKFESELAIVPLGREPDPEIKVLFYRAAQEALSNLTRHSQATRVRLTLEPRGPFLRLTVQDDGVGFDVARFLAAPPSVQSGIGLRTIREQAAELGGKLEIISQPSATTLEVAAPFTAPE